MKTFIHFVLALFFSSILNCFAQTNLSTNGLGSSSADASSLFSGLKVIEYGRNIGSLNNGERIEGSPYLYKNWNNKSKIWYDDKIFNIDLLNYNLRDKRFEIKLNNDSIFIISDANHIKKIEINNILFKPYNNDELNRSLFYEVVLDNDNFSLLIKYYLKIKDGDIDPLTKSYIKPKEYVTDKDYFILRHNKGEKMYPIKLKKSDILKLIDDANLDQVKNFVKKRRLKYKEISDVKIILEYYNSIKS